MANKQSIPHAEPHVQRFVAVLPIMPDVQKMWSSAYPRIGLVGKACIRQRTASRRQYVRKTGLYQIQDRRYCTVMHHFESRKVVVKNL